MNKLKLKLDDLKVDSFSPAPAEKGNGTVFAEQCTCPGAVTCGIACMTVEGNTCEGRTCDNEPYWWNGQWVYC